MNNDIVINNSVPTDSVHTDSIPTDSIPTDSVHTNTEPTSITISAFGPGFKVKNINRVRKYLVKYTNFRNMKLQARFYYENNRLFIQSTADNGPFDVVNQLGYRLNDELGTIIKVGGEYITNKIDLVKTIQKNLKNKSDFVIEYEGLENIHSIFPDRTSLELAEKKITKRKFDVSNLVGNLIIPEPQLGYNITDVNTEDDFEENMNTFLQEFKIIIANSLVEACNYDKDYDPNLKSKILANIKIKHLYK